MKKRVLCIVLVINLVLCTIPNTIFAMADSNSKVLLQLSKNDVGIVDEPEMKPDGPESFFVKKENQIYVCDTVNSQIVYFENGQLTSKIKIDTNDRLLDLFLDNDIFYILTDNNQVLEVNKDGVIINMT